MLLTLLFFLRFNGKGIAIAGIFTGFAILTNMTAAPYFCFNLIYLSIFGFKKKVDAGELPLKRFNLCFLYIIPAVIILGLVTLLMAWYTEGQFLQNVIFDQVGTYPKEHTLLYMLGKMKWIGEIILSLEGPLILVSLAGLILYIIRTRKESQNFVLRPSTYIFFYMLMTLGSFIFATKGGTVDYIFTLGEPAVAIFGAFIITLLIQKISNYFKSIWSWGIGIVLLLVLSYPGIRQDILTLRGTNYELDAAEVNRVVAVIQQQTKSTDLIFAPPYFAFLAERKIVGEFSEQFVWFMKYANYVRYHEGNPKTMHWIAAMSKLIEDKQVKFIMLNIDPSRGQQTGQIGPIRDAVDANYYPVGELQMRNETLTIFLPK